MLKICSKCKIEKFTLDFSKNKNTKSGLSSYCKSCNTLNTTMWRINNPEKQAILHWKTDIKNFYNITSKDYHKLLQKQDYSCAICLIRQDQFKKRLSIDHCHISGNIRGLLCFNCNTALGKFKDSVQLLQSAQRYLEKENICP